MSTRRWSSRPASRTCRRSTTAKRCSTFRLYFGEDFAVSYRVLRNQTFNVSGGAVTKARRVNGREDLREMYIQPETTGDISIQLAATMSCSATGAICTKDDRLPSNSDSDTVKEPTTISVADATVEEAVRAELRFGVTHRPQRDQRRDGDSRCRVHVDRRNAYVWVGDRTKTVTVPELDDDHDDPSVRNSTASVGSMPRCFVVGCGRGPSS